MGWRERLQSYIRHREWASWTRANMESAKAAAPIVRNGFWGAKPVNGVMLPGVALVAMRGRSVSSQAWEGDRDRSGSDCPAGVERLMGSQRREADARELVGHRAGGLVAVRACIQLPRNSTVRADRSFEADTQQHCAARRAGEHTPRGAMPLVELPLDSLHDEPITEAEAAWEQEIRRRVEALERGEAETCAAVDVFAEARRIAP